MEDTLSSGENSWISTCISDHTKLGSPICFGDQRRINDSIHITNEGSVDEEVRRLQQQLKELEITAHESNDRAINFERRAEESERRVEESDRIVGELHRDLTEVRESLQERTREVQLMREQLAREQVSQREVEKSDKMVLQIELAELRQNFQERTREVQLVREQYRECEQRLAAYNSHWVVRNEDIEITGPELGRGGWTTVSVATFRGMRVAAKVMHHLIVSHRYVQLFRCEISMTARLRHPNLVQFIGATIEGTLVILTELMHTSLRALLQEVYYFAPNVVISVSLDVARALNYMHLMQPDPFIHGDLSSSNVLLNPIPGNQWRAKLTDYGTVNPIDQLDYEAGPGTNAYAAPEYQNPRLRSTKIDIYGLGVLMLEMLTGQFPTAEDRPTLLLQVRHDQLLDLIQRCLRERMQDRPTAATIIGELNQ